MSETRERYSAFTLTLHWVTVALVLTQIAILWISADFDKAERGVWMMGHKSVGLTILILTLARLSSRLFGHPALPLPSAMPGWEKVVARGTHVLFYVLLIAMPLAGWASSTAAGRPIMFFWTFPWPDLPFVPHDRHLAKTIIDMHEFAGKTLIGLIILHILAALKHHFIDKDNLLRRMLPFLPRRMT